MVVVTAVAFAVGAVCLRYGARALRTRRAVRRIDAEDDALGDPTDWLDPPGDRLGRRSGSDSDFGGDSDSASAALGDPGAGVSVERGFVLLVLGLLCLLFGLLAL